MRNGRQVTLTTPEGQKTACSCFNRLVTCGQMGPVPGSVVQSANYIDSHPRSAFCNAHVHSSWMPSLKMLCSHIATIFLPFGSEQGWVSFLRRTSGSGQRFPYNHAFSSFEQQTRTCININIWLWIWPFSPTTLCGINFNFGLPLLFLTKSWTWCLSEWVENLNSVSSLT